MLYNFMNKVFAKKPDIPELRVPQYWTSHLREEHSLILQFSEPVVDKYLNGPLLRQISQ